jgi:hypothetical protein
MNMEKYQVRRAGRLAALLGLLALAGCGGDAADPARSAVAGQLTAPADLALIGQVADDEELVALGLSLDPMPADAALVSSHYAIALAGVAVADELTYDQLRALNLHFRFRDAETRPLQAGPDREFLVVYLTEPESADVVLGGDSAEVIVDGETRPLEAVPHADEALVVNVPVDGDATLAITDAGETKTISLRTGDRDAGGNQDHPADALDGGVVRLEEGVAIAGVSEPGYADGIQVNVSLRPFGHDDERGWADEGHMWLEIAFDYTYAGLVAEQAMLSLDLAESLTIEGSDGTPVEIPSDVVVEATIVAAGGLATGEWEGVVQVPDSLRRFEVSYTTNGTFAAPGGDARSFTRQEVTPTGTIELTER